jgi:ABC-type dipeptide/oligopeptide/nickel transport system ATPase component
VKESEITDHGAGCRFYSRCPHAMEKCKAPPPLFRMDKHQAASCYLHDSYPQISSDHVYELLPV